MANVFAPRGGPSLIVRLLGLLADRRLGWLLAGVAGFCSILFFFEMDQGLRALLFVALSFITLPGGVMARSMLARGLPKLPVMSGLIGLFGGLGFGLSAGTQAFTQGAFGPLGAVAFVIVASFVGFTLCGGVANFLTAKPPASPPAAKQSTDD